MGCAPRSAPATTPVPTSRSPSRWSSGLQPVSPDSTPKTVVETRRFIDNYVIPHLGRVKVRNFTTAELDGVYCLLKKSGGRAGRPLSVASVRRVHVVVRRALSQAKRWG